MKTRKCSECGVVALGTFPIHHSQHMCCFNWRKRDELRQYFGLHGEGQMTHTNCPHLHVEHGTTGIQLCCDFSAGAAASCRCRGLPLRSVADGKGKREILSNYLFETSPSVFFDRFPIVGKTPHRFCKQ